MSELECLSLFCEEGSLLDDLCDFSLAECLERELRFSTLEESVARASLFVAGSPSELMEENDSASEGGSLLAPFLGIRNAFGRFSSRSSFASSATKHRTHICRHN